MGGRWIEGWMSMDGWINGELAGGQVNGWINSGWVVDIKRLKERLCGLPRLHPDKAWPCDMQHSFYFALLLQLPVLVDYSSLRRRTHI